jgi:hypothetical protein
MKGMQKIKRGTGFRGACEYALEEGRGQIIGGNMTGVTPRELAAEFGQSRKIREDIEKPVWHNSLRLPEGERIPVEKWEKIADDYMQKMGFNDLHQRVYILHDDEKGQHIHVIASRIDLTGQIYLGQNENLKSTRHIAQLEQDHGLIITQLEPDPDKPRQRPPTPGETGMAERTGEVPIRLQLQAIIDQASADRPEFAEFAARLDASGVSILPSGKTGAPQGVSFEMNGQPFKGSELGKSYSWKGLQARIDYDRDRDQYIIDDLRGQAARDSDEEKGELTTALPYPDPAPYKGPPRTLELTLDREGDTYKWKTGGRVALIDNGDSIAVMSRADSAIKASLQLAKDKGWQSVTATGNEEFRRKSWLIGSEMGINVEGYEPSQADRDELKNIQARKEAARNERKNSANAGSRPYENPDNGGAGRDDRATSVKPSQFDRGNSGDNAGRPEGIDGHTERGGIPENNGRLLGDLQTATAGTDHSRSSGLADTPVRLIDRPDILGISVRADRVEAVAAPASDRSQDRGERSNTVRPDQKPISPDQTIKIAAWRSQHEALGAPAYRITLVDRDPERIKKHGGMGLGYVLGKKTGNNIKTPDDVESSISTLRRENARLFDIYITPIDDKNHYILIDDIHEEKAGKLTKFRSDNFKPALIQFSSSDNYQAILKVPRIDGDHDFANEVFQKLNTEFGETGIKGGAVHAFRMAGFANKKPGKSGFTRLIETNPGALCEKTGGLIKMAIENHDAEKRAREIEKEKMRRLKAIESHDQGYLSLGSSGDEVLRAYKKSFNRTLGLAQKKGWTIDLSKIDFAATKDLLKQGYKSDLIEKAIVNGSPNIDLRKGQHMDDYARLTVQNAAISKDVLDHNKDMTEQAKRRDNS